MQPRTITALKLSLLFISISNIFLIPCVGLPTYDPNSGSRGYPMIGFDVRIDPNITSIYRGDWIEVTYTLHSEGGNPDNPVNLYICLPTQFSSVHISHKEDFSRDVRASITVNNDREINIINWPIEADHSTYRRISYIARISTECDPTRDIDLDPSNKSQMHTQFENIYFKGTLVKIETVNNPPNIIYFNKTPPKDLKREGYANISCKFEDKDDANCTARLYDNNSSLDNQQIYNKEPINCNYKYAYSYSYKSSVPGPHALYIEVDDGHNITRAYHPIFNISKNSEFEDTLNHYLMILVLGTAFITIGISIFLISSRNNYIFISLILWYLIMALLVGSLNKDLLLIPTYEFALFPLILVWAAHFIAKNFPEKKHSMFIFCYPSSELP